MKLTYLLFSSLLLSLTACGTDVATVVEEQPVVRPQSESRSALIDGTVVQPGGTPIKGGLAECQSICTATSRCDTPCTDGITKTCGTFGVCISCAAVCDSSAPCGQACLESGQVTDCPGAHRTCAQCSEAACRTSGCGGYCMNPPPQKCYLGNCGPTYSRCDAYGATIDDKDSDGLPDTLEAALAQRFFPSLQMTASSQHQFYGLTRDAWGYDTLCANNPNCKLPYVVRPLPPLYGARQGWCAQGQCIELSFVLPYNWDLGDVFGVTSHRGDGEFVSMVLAWKRADDEPNGLDWGTTSTWEQARTDASLWRPVGRFYAAHLCSGADSSRFVFPSTSVPQTMMLNDTMRVYVAESKNGSYPSMASCDDGGNYFDNCEGGVWLDRTPLLAKLVNAGEEVGGSIPRPGYVCSGFARTIAKPMYAFSPSTTTLDIWGTESFDTSTKLYHLLRRFELDWGAGTRSCAW